MKEIRFKVLREGDELHSFDNKFMIIKKKNGEYYVYRVSGLDGKLPVFDRENIIIITNGIGKIETYDSDTQISTES
jgi:hypothetical protein